MEDFKKLMTDYVDSKITKLPMAGGTVTGLIEKLEAKQRDIRDITDTANIELNKIGTLTEDMKAEAREFMRKEVARFISA